MVNVTPEAPPAHPPIVDLSKPMKEVASDIMDAATTVGFFYVTG